MESFEQLQAWKEAHQLVLMIYKETKSFPSDERYRLVSQICRSAASVAANLVEGNARASIKEYLQYINQAKGSLEETKYHLLLARDLKYLPEKNPSLTVFLFPLASNLCFSGIFSLTFPEQKKLNVV